MTLKKSFASVVLLLAAVVLAGCSSFLPTAPGQPGVEIEYGTVSFSVDLSQAHEADIAAVIATLVGGAQVITEELRIVGNAAEAVVHGVETGQWQATVALHDQDGEIASKRHDVSVAKGRTTTVELAAQVVNGTVTLDVPDATEPGDGGAGNDPGDEDPGVGEPGDEDEEEAQPAPGVTREVRYIQSGSRTETRTEVYIVRGPEPGPTVMLVGGVHGSERSGWMVAGEVAREWEIDRGTLVVIPEANKDAVRRTKRTGRDERDLNRAFPKGRAMGQAGDWLLAKEIWGIVEEFRPDALLDLHEGWGLREANDRFPGGTLSVGQTFIVHPVGDAEQFAEHVVNVLNTEHNPFYGRNGLTYNFQIIGPPVDGSLARKAGNDLGIPAFIAEPTQGRSGRHQTTVAQRQDWHRVIVEEFMRWYGVLD